MDPEPSRTGTLALTLHLKAPADARVLLHWRRFPEPVANHVHLDPDHLERLPVEPLTPHKGAVLRRLIADIADAHLEVPCCPT